MTSLNWTFVCWPQDLPRTANLLTNKFICFYASLQTIGLTVMIGPTTFIRLSNSLLAKWRQHSSAALAVPTSGTECQQLTELVATSLADV